MKMGSRQQKTATAAITSTVPTMHMYTFQIKAALADPYINHCLSFWHPNWVWLYAHQLATPRVKCDNIPPYPWVDWAYQFLAPRSQRARAKELPPLTSHLRASIAEAIRIRDGDDFAREIVEAWLLAGVSYAEIESHTSVAAGAAETYENLFFNFRPKLSACSWMAGFIVGVPRHGEGTTRGILLRKMGLRGGPLVLPALIEVIRKLSNPRLAAVLPDKTTPEGQLEASIRRTIALEMMPDNCRTFVTLSRIHEQLLRKQKSPAPVADDSFDDDGFDDDSFDDSVTIDMMTRWALERRVAA